MPYDSASGDDVRIACWNGTEWVILETTADPVTGLVSAQISHFSLFAVLKLEKEISQVSEVISIPVSSSVSTPAAIPPVSSITKEIPAIGEPEAPASSQDESGLKWWGILLIVIVAVVVLLFSVRLMLNRRRISNG
jgi:hypothetical protein